MKCPKCGKEATLMETITFHLKKDDDILRNWGITATFERYIHFKCLNSETPNFVFFIEKEDIE